MDFNRMLLLMDLLRYEIVSGNDAVAANSLVSRLDNLESFVEYLRDTEPITVVTGCNTPMTPRSAI